VSPGGTVRPLLWRWGPLVVWMAAISVFSTDTFSAEETGGLLEPVLRWLIPTISAAGVEAVHVTIRKGMHVAEFALLAVLWYRGLAWGTRGWRPRTALAAFGLSVVCAGLDEGHQAFVATRTASLLDVAWDSVGALCGVGVSRVLWGGAWSERKSNAPGDAPPRRIEVAERD
jgi:VanZ family protein